MRRKILVVDNCPVTLRLISHMLPKEDYEVTTATDGLDALQIMEEFKPDIVVTDLIMPMVSGDKLCRIIRKKPEFNNVFIVILSAIAAEEEIDFIGFGADACIAKGPAKEMISNILTVFGYAETKNREELPKQIFGIKNVHVRQIIKELLSSKKSFEIIIQNMADGFMTLTPSGRIVSANSHALDFFNTPEEKLISTTFFDHFEADQKDIIFEKFNEISTSAIELGENNPIILHGRYLLIKMVPVFDETLQSVIVLMDDITERKVTESELQQYRIHLEELVAQRSAEIKEVNVNLQDEISERQKVQEQLIHTSTQLHNTLNTINDFVSVHDINMKIVMVNKSLSDFLKKDADELLGQNCYEIMHGTKEPWPQCPHLEAMKNGKTTTREINDPHIGRPLLVTCSPYFDEKGVLIGTVHVARDISQQKLAEEDREKLIAKLQNALSKVKQLSGFLPICASCKKIRDDHGYWKQIELYIRDHSEAEFSHSICPDCVKKLYPDQYDEIYGKKS
jgi:PAS domain S-box-containing protein